MTKENKRPKNLFSFSRCIVTGCGKMYISAVYQEGALCEVQINLGKAGGCASAFIDAIKSMITQSIQFGMPIDLLIESMKGIKCHRSGDGENKMYCCPDAIAEVLEASKEIIICPLCGSHVKDDGKCVNPDCRWKVKKVVKDEE